jgi:hypothetical protein
MSKTGAREIKSAWITSPSPLVVQIVYTSGGSDSYTAHQLYSQLTPAAQARVAVLTSSSAAA